MRALGWRARPCWSQKSCASSLVKARCAARTSCRRPVSRSRCRPIGGSNRQPKRDPQAPVAPLDEVPDAVEHVAVADLVHVVEDEEHPPFLVAQDGEEVRDERRVRRAARCVQRRDRRGGRARGLREGDDDGAPEGGAVVVALAGHPGDRHPGTALLLREVDEQRRLAVAGRRAGEQDVGPGRGPRRLRRGVDEQTRTLDHPVEPPRHRHLGSWHRGRGAQACHASSVTSPRTGGDANPGPGPVRRR